MMTRSIPKIKLTVTMQNVTCALRRYNCAIIVSSPSLQGENLAIGQRMVKKLNLVIVIPQGYIRWYCKVAFPPKQSNTSQEKIAHLHCTKRSAVQVSAVKLLRNDS